MFIYQNGKSPSAKLEAVDKISMKQCSEGNVLFVAQAHLLWQHIPRLEDRSLNFGFLDLMKCVSNLPNKKMPPLGSPGNWYSPKTMKLPLASRVNL